MSIKAELQKLMDIVLKGEINPLTELPEDMPVGPLVALDLPLAAVADNKCDAIKTVMEHLDGRLAESLNLGGQEDDPVEIDGNQMPMTTALARSGRLRLSVIVDWTDGAQGKQDGRSHS